MQHLGNLLKKASALFLAITLTAAALTVFSASVKPVRVGFFKFDGYHMVDEFGDRSGYGYEYLQNMARYADFVYEYVGYDKSWNEMQDMLEAGEIDLLTSAHKTEERQKRFDYSRSPIGTSATILTVKAGDNRYMTDHYEDLAGIRVGLLRGNSRNDSFAAFAREKGFSFEPVYFDGDKALIAALQAGEVIDAAVTSNLRKIHNEWVVVTFDPSDFYVMVRKGDRQLLDQIDQAIGALETYDPNLQTRLFDKYYAAESGDEISFTPEERAYIRAMRQQGTEIPVYVNPDRAPLSYFEDGQAKGIIPEIMAELLYRTGLSYRIVEVASSEEYRQKVNAGEAVVQLDSRSDYNKAERNGYKLTEPYMESSISYVTLRQFTGEPETVAAVKDSDIAESFIQKMYPDDVIVYYDSARECVNAVLTGKQDAVYLYTYMAQKVVFDDARNRLKETLVPKQDIKFAMSIRQTENPLLFSILNKAVLSYSREKVGDIVRRQTSGIVRPFSLLGYLYSHPVILLGGILLAAFLAILLILYSFRRKSRKLELERVKEFERFITYVCRANDNVIEIDLEKSTCYYYHIQDNKVLRGEGPPYNDGDLASAIHPDQREELQDALSSHRLGMLVDTCGEFYFECRAKWRKADYIWYACTIQGMHQDEVHPRSFMLFIKNIDRAKREEAQRRQNLMDALASAQQASEAKGAFMSRMSHEIRTPLNAIIGYLSIAETFLGDREKAGECLSKSAFAARHLLNIINDVLDISAIESGRMKIASAPFNIRGLISSISSIFYTQARDKGVKFNVMLRDVSEESLIGDELRLNQILMNLLSNAVKFTTSGGRVTLTITQKKLSDQRVHLQLDVADTGIGIAEAYLEQLFTPFEQADASTARNFGGTGLGLSITKNLITMMNGAIDVQSKEGEGSVFSVTLSFEMEKLEERKFAWDFSGFRILAIYDQAEDRAPFQETLQRFGVRNELVFTIDEAVERIQNQGADMPYDLCLLDWNPAGENGVEAVRRLHDAASHGKPAIIVVAFDDSEIPEEVRKEVAQVVKKPLFQSCLFDLLMDNRKQWEVPSLPHHPAAFQNARILLAEDNEMNMEIATEILSSAGFTVDRAVNGAAAVDAFERSRPGTYLALLMDIQMPVMDGYEATRKIRAGSHPEAGTVPIIALTADAFAEDVNRALAAGMNDHVAKPIDFQQLCEVLRKYISDTALCGR